MALAMTRKDDRPVTYLTDFEDQSTGSDEDSLVIPEDLTALAADDLTALRGRAVEAFNAIYQDGRADLSQGDLDTLQVLTEGITALNAEVEVREAAVAERLEAAATLAAQVAPPAAENGEEGDETVSADGGEGGQDATAEVSPDSAAESDEGASDAALVASTAPRRSEVRVNLSGLASRQVPSQRGTGEAPTSMRDVVFAAPDTGVFATGAGMDFTDMARAVNHRLTSVNTAAFENAARSGRTLRQQYGIATIRKPFEDGLRIESNDPDHVESVFSLASSESRLPGGSLVASGGWCAPSEVLYDLFENESRDGLFSVPEVNITRGGIRWTPGPDFSTLYSDIAGFNYTEQQDIDGDYDGQGGGSKPCYHVECAEFQEARLDLAGLCITAGLLQQRGYPEVIARTIRGALVAHDHRMSSRKINAIVAGSTAVAMPAGQVGATAPVLTAIELQVEHYRDIHRLSRSTSLEAVFPYWVRGAIRSDLSRRLGVDLLSVPDSRINAWFAERGVNAQFVYNWQSVGTTGAGSFTKWPDEVSFLLYAAGTWVAGGSDVITLDTLYDSTLLGTNDYTALFTEEGWLMAKRGHDSRVVTVPICANGNVGGGVEIACDGTAVTE